VDSNSNIHRDYVRSFITGKSQGEQLRIRYEAWPDHFGWLLYAFSRLRPTGGNREHKRMTLKVSATSEAK
jgi:hypothetical protein